MSSQKRSIELQPLSRQHHNGLLFCLLLEKGVKKNADKIIMRDFCIYFWQGYLQHHFEIEEKYLIPLAAHIELGVVLYRMKEEHLQIKKYFEDAAKLNTDADFEQIHQLINDHIRFEERELFPLIQLVISVNEMHELGHAFENETDDNCMNYPIKFWD